jgi:hypothetical protein
LAPNMLLVTGISPIEGKGIKEGRD